MAKKLWMIFFWGVPVLLTALIFYAAAHYQPGQDHQIGSSGANRAEAPSPGFLMERVEKWQNEEFVPLTNGVNLQQLVGGFSCKIPEPLSENESEALTNAVVSLINAFHVGSFEAYTQFRIPVEHFHFSDAANSILRKTLSVPAETLKNDPSDAWKIFWGKFVGDKYTNYWIGIAVTNCEIVVEESTVPTNNLMKSLLYSSAKFTIDSIKAPALFAQRVAKPADSDKISQFLKEKISPDTSKLLENYVAGKDFDATQKALLKDLNDIISGGPIYTPERFAGAKLSGETKALLKGNPQGEDLVCLNRLLLTDAYPQIFLPFTPVENLGFSLNSVPCVLLEPSRADVIKAKGSVKVMTVRMMCKLRNSVAVYPIFVRFYWSPDDGKWLPEQLVAADAHPGRGLDLFF